MAQWLERLRALPGRSGYVTAAYGGRYFTYPNARRIDAVREAIAAAAAAGAGRRVIQALLASLILGADRAANTVGQYDAFLKHLGRPAVSDGRHLVDSRVYQPLRLVPVAAAPVGARVITADLLAMIGTLEVEVAYVDPPYNDRQYSSNYHVLENLARWERPPVTGKTRKFPSDHLKSPFSRRREVRGAFERMVERCRAPLLFVSYNSEGLLAIDELERILATAGTVTRWDYRYPVFGHGAGVARKRTVTEHLLALRRGRGPRG